MDSTFASRPPEGTPAKSGGTLRVHVVAATFPSRIQPWLLNSIEQVMRLGGQVTVLAGQAGNDGFPNKVKALGLLEATVYLAGGEGLVALRRIVTRCGKAGPDGALCRRGLGRAVRSFPRLANPQSASSALRCIPALGLDRPDLVHAHSMVWAYAFSRILHILRVPLIMTFHGLTPEGVGVLEESKRKFLFSRVTRILVNTRFAQAQVESLGAPAAKIEILPQGIDLDDFPFQPKPYPQERRPRLLTVGRLHPDKGHRYALEAVARLARSGVDVDYTVVGIGPLSAELRVLAAELGISDRVSFLGAVDDAGLRKAYADSDIFVLPSLRDRVGRHEETQGVVLQEAQATGLLVVATRTGGIPECLADGRSAALVPDRDSVALADTLKTIIDDPERWPAWQRQGREWTETRFDANELGRRLLEIYRQVTEGRSFDHIPGV